MLAPLALMPGPGRFPLPADGLAVAFAMISAYILSRTFVPSRVGSSAQWAMASRNGDDPGNPYEEDGNGGPSHRAGLRPVGED